MPIESRTSCTLLTIAALLSACTAAEAPQISQQTQAVTIENATRPFVDRAVCRESGLFCFMHRVGDSAGRLIILADLSQSGFGATDLASAYNFDPTRDPGDTTIAIVGAYGYPNAESDLAAYRTEFNLPPCTIASGCLTIVNQQGQTSPLPAEGSSSDQTNQWTVELALDLQMASAGCPKCKLLLVEATDQGFDNMLISEATAASFNPAVINNSWGYDEPEINDPKNAACTTAGFDCTITNLDSMLGAIHAQYPNIGIFFASGDSGYDHAGLGPDFPATSEFVTAVGGTTLAEDTSARGFSEVAWAYSAGLPPLIPAGGGGSACSITNPKPTWQSASGFAGNSACPYRMTADVAAIGGLDTMAMLTGKKTGVVIYNKEFGSQYGGNGWLPTGGTSAASPLVASIFALYGLGSQSLSYAYSHPTAFYDITSGSNADASATGQYACPKSSILCTSGTGWDGPTGFGTPNGAAMQVTTKPNGGSCTVDGECQSDHCAQGVCCDSACVSPCGACTIALGSTADGHCTSLAASCSLNNLCTSGDHCQNGACVAGTTKSCPASDVCHLAATCDAKTGQCPTTFPPAPDGTGCDTGDVCTTGQCKAGVCTGSTPKTCPALDPCHQAGSCDPKTGCGSYPNATDGTKCSTNNPCTSGDSCSAGTCVAGTTKSCPAPDVCHLAGTCDPQTGACSTTYPPAPDGTSCDTLCATGQCKSGVCSGGTPKACPAPDPCHLSGSCNPATGQCYTNYPNAPDNTACSTSLCSVGDHCAAGTCTAGTPKSCPAPDACHLAGTCDPKTGSCGSDYPTVADGTACSSGNLCSTGDQCKAGVCSAGTAKSCPAPDVCHLAGTCVAATGLCPTDFPLAPDGTACGAGLQCVSGVCQGSAGLDAGSSAKTDGGASHTDSGTQAPASSSGCGCGAGGSAPTSVLFGLLALCLVRRRRTA